MKEISINWKLMGAKLARLSDEEQAEFFKGFVFELKTWDTNASVQFQLAGVNIKMTPKEREYMRKNLPSLWFEEGVDI
jgi:hypothetical protein